MAILSILFTVIIIAVSILLVLIVLVQRPKQEGLGAAFGGGTLDSALGANTTDVLQKITTMLGIIFFVSAIGLAMVKAREFRTSAASDLLESVEEREMDLPDFAPELSGLPAIPESEEAPGVAEDAAPAVEDDVPDQPDAPAAAPDDAAAPENGSEEQPQQ